MQAAGAAIAATAKTLRVRTAAVAFMGLPALSDAEKVLRTPMYSPESTVSQDFAAASVMLLATHTNRRTKHKRRTRACTALRILKI